MADVRKILIPCVNSEKLGINVENTAKKGARIISEIFASIVNIKLIRIDNIIPQPPFLTAYCWLLLHHLSLIFLQEFRLTLEMKP